MRAAGIRFAEGCYQNEIEYTQETTGDLRFGLKCNVYKSGCWCCFDNFALYYQALPDFYDGIGTIHEEQTKMTDDIYDLQGRKAKIQPQGIYILGGKKVVVK